MRLRLLRRWTLRYQVPEFRRTGETESSVKSAAGRTGGTWMLPSK